MPYVRQDLLTPLITTARPGTGRFGLAPPVLLGLLAVMACGTDGTDTESDIDTSGDASTTTMVADSDGETGTGELPTTGTDPADTEAETTWVLAGPVRLKAGLVPPLDAIGTLHVALASACGDWGTTLPGLHMVMHDVDLGMHSASYLFEVQEGTYHLIAFLDEDGGDADATPGPGDLVFENVDQKGCRTYELKGGNGYINTPVDLDASVPFPKD